MTGFFCDGPNMFTAYLNDELLNIETFDEFSIPQENVLELQPGSKVQNLAYDSTTNLFTFEYVDFITYSYTLGVKITGATGLVCELKDGNIVVEFDATSDIFVSITETVVTS